jgi:hypothetical protein
LDFGLEETFPLYVLALFVTSFASFAPLRETDSEPNSRPRFLSQYWGGFHAEAQREDAKIRKSSSSPAPISDSFFAFLAYFAGTFLSPVIRVHRCKSVVPSRRFFFGFVPGKFFAKIQNSRVPLIERKKIRTS